MILILEHAPGDPRPLPLQLLSAEPRRARCSSAACLRRLGVPQPPRVLAARARKSRNVDETTTPCRD